MYSRPAGVARKRRAFHLGAPDFSAHPRPRCARGCSGASGDRSAAPGLCRDYGKVGGGPDIGLPSFLRRVNSRGRRPANANRELIIPGRGGFGWRGRFGRGRLLRSCAGLCSRSKCAGRRFVPSGGIELDWSRYGAWEK